MEDKKNTEIQQSDEKMSMREASETIKALVEEGKKNGRLSSKELLQTPCWGGGLCDSRLAPGLGRRWLCLGTG